MTQRYRVNLTARLLLILSGMAAFSTVLALLIQDRALSGDLNRAARSRLERAAEATNLLVESHIEAQRQRYRAISGTPQFRATLEVRDGPTLQFFARQLAAKEGAALVAFLDPEGRPIAVAGDDELMGAVLNAREASLLAHQGRALAVAAIPLQTSGQLIGRLVAVEPIGRGVIERWSDLCGADVSFVVPGQAQLRDTERVVRRLAGGELRVSASREAEHEALTHSRYNLLTAGAVAMVLAFAVSTLVSRSVVRPILQLQNAVVRSGQGDFSTRFDSRRGDEIGDLARAFDLMLGRLGDYRDQVESQHHSLEDKVTRLRSSQEQLANAQRLAHIGSWHVDLETRELWGSNEFRTILGLAQDDKPIAPESVLDVIDPEDRAGLESGIDSCLREGATLRLDCRISLRDAAPRILRVQAQIRTDEDGRQSLLEGTVQDVTERERAEEQIRYLAYHDSLTGLGNRLLCRERLAIQITQARRLEEAVGVLFLDLDRFKRINDTLGHSLGDELLKEVANRLTVAVRETDFIGRKEARDSVSRLGGDEFTVVVTGIEDVQDLAKVARRILTTVTRPFELAGHEVAISGSIGIAAFPFDGEDVESILRNADAAMYHAKERGPNNYQFYAESMNEVALRRLILENKLRQGLERNEFELHYQPKVCVETGAMTGVEALVRWRDPETGLVPPGVFIPIAEETGLISPLGDWILREACRQIVEWREAGHPVPVSVNLSTHQFRSGRLAEKILEILEESSIEPELLELEITESTLMHDEETVVADLEQLRSSGIRIAVDDFGTGYSSFAYLRRLPVDVIKIDRSFIVEIATNADDAALAASIIMMAKALRLRVIAEGVETGEQRDLLVTWGCDEIQGFLFSRPLTAQALQERLGRGSAQAVLFSPEIG